MSARNTYTVSHTCIIAPPPPSIHCTGLPSRCVTEADADGVPEQHQGPRIPPPKRGGPCEGHSEVLATCA